MNLRTSFLDQKNFSFALIFLFLLSFIAYGNGLNNEFLIDDFGLVVSNSISSLGLIPDAFGRTFGGQYYRPFVTISFIFDYFFWKLNPFGFHLSNIILHSINAILFFIFLYMLFENFELSLLTSVLFAIHPINSVSVNYISDRGNLLAGIFMLSSLISFGYGYKLGLKRGYGFGFLLFVCALLCRENAMIFPLYLAGVLLFLYRKNTARFIAAAFIFVSVIDITYIVLRSYYFPLSTAVYKNHFPLFSLERLHVFFIMIWEYLSLAVFPYGVVFFRKINPAQLNWLNVLCFSLICSGIVFLVRVFRKNRIFVFGLIWFLIGVVPLYKLLDARPEIGYVMQDSWVYFSSMGIFLIFSSLILFFKKHMHQIIYFIFVAIIFLTFVIATVYSNLLWKDSKTYCTYWLKYLPENPIAYISLGYYYLQNKDYELALYYYKKALDKNKVERDGEIFISKKTGKIYSQMGAAFYKQKIFNQAARYFIRALKINPNDLMAAFGLANTYYRQRDFKKAEEYYVRTLQINPRLIKARSNLVLVYKEIGDEHKALKQLQLIRSLNRYKFKE